MTTDVGLRFVAFVACTFAYTSSERGENAVGDSYRADLEEPTLRPLAAQHWLARSIACSRLRAKILDGLRHGDIQLDRRRSWNFTGKC